MKKGETKDFSINEKLLVVFNKPGTDHKNSFHHLDPVVSDTEGTHLGWPRFFGSENTPVGVSTDPYSRFTGADTWNVRYLRRTGLHLLRTGPQTEEDKVPGGPSESKLDKRRKEPLRRRDRWW